MVCVDVLMRLFLEPIKMLFTVHLTFAFEGRQIYGICLLFASNQSSVDDLHQTFR